MLVYYAYRLLGWLTPRLPPWLSYWFLARLGDLFYWLDARGRQVVHENLRHVLGPDMPSDALAGMVRHVFHNQAYNYCDLFRIPYLNPREIEERVILEGWEHLEAAIGMGQGVIAVSAHFGNIDVALQVVGLRGIHSTIIVEHIQPEPLFQYIAGIRGGYGLRVVPVDASLKVLFRALRAGELVILAMDRDITGTGVEIEFFGMPAQLPDGYAELSRQTGAPILLAFGLRLPDHRVLVRIEPAIIPPQTEDRKADVRAIMRQVIDISERYIREHPEQWVMFQPVW